MNIIGVVFCGSGDGGSSDGGSGLRLHLGRLEVLMLFPFHSKLAKMRCEYNWSSCGDGWGLVVVTVVVMVVVVVPAAAAAA